MIRSVKCGVLTKVVGFMRRSTVLFSSSLASLRSSVEEEEILDSIETVHIQTRFRFPVSISGSERSSLLHLVSYTVKTVNWDNVKEISFANSVKLCGFSHSLESFAILVGIFSSSRMHMPARCLIKCLIDYDIEINSQFSIFDLPSSLVNLSHGAINLLKAYGGLIQVLIESNLLEASFQAYKQAKNIGVQIGTPLCNLLLYNFIETDEFDLAKSLFQEMKQIGPIPNIHTYTIYLSLYAKSNNFDINEANFIWIELEKNGLKPNMVTMGTYIHLFCGAGLSETAWKFLKESKEKNLIKYNTRCFNPIIHGFCREGNLDNARTVFDAMKDFDSVPNVRTFSILINGYCKKGEILKAYDLLLEMVNKYGLNPNIYTCSSLVHGACIKGDMKIALNFFNEIKNNGLEYDLVSYSILLNGFCNIGEIDKAVVVWREIVERGITLDAFNYTSIIHHYVKKGCLKEAIDHFDLMRENGVGPTIVTCTIIIEGFCKLGFLEDAFKFLNDMNEWGLKPNKFTYKVLINGLCKSQKLYNAYGVLGLGFKSGLEMDVVLYTIFIDCLSKMQFIDEATRIFDLIQPNIYTYTSLINGLLNNGRFQDALNLYKKFSLKGLKPDKVLYTTMISCYCKNGEMKIAKELFAEMVELGFEPDIRVFSCLINGYSESGLMDNAEVLMNKMAKLGLEPNVATYTCVIKGFRKMGDWNKAYEMYNYMISKGIKADKLANLTIGRNVTHNKDCVSEDNLD